MQIKQLYSLALTCFEKKIENFQKNISRFSKKLFQLFGVLGQFLEQNPGFLVRKSRDFPKFPKIEVLSGAQKKKSVKIFVYFKIMDF